MTTQIINPNRNEQEIIETNDDFKSFEQQLDNLDKPQEFQIVSLITNSYILSQFNSPQPNIDPQAQSIPSFRVTKNQLNINSEVNAGKKNSSDELQDQDIQSLQNKQPLNQEDLEQQNQSSQNPQNQNSRFQEDLEQQNQSSQIPQNQNSRFQEDHEQQNQSSQIPQNQNSKSQEDLQQQNQRIQNPENSQTISKEDHQQSNQSTLNPQNQLQSPKFKDQSIQNPQNKYIISQLDHEGQHQGIYSSQNQQFKSQEDHKQQQYLDIQNHQQLKLQQEREQQSQSIQNKNQQEQNQFINNSNNKNKQFQQIQDGKKTDMSSNQQNQTLVQGQTMKTIDKQKQQEVQYYVYADLKNFLGILTDVTETLKFFDGTQDAAYIPIAINRLILQCNLSNGIHFDCQHNFQSDYQKKLYLQEKQNALQILKESLDKMQIPKNYIIHQCIARYEQTLGNKTELKTIEPLKVDRKASINQETLTKIIGGMQEVDKQLQDVSKGIYQKPEKEDLQKSINERKLIAQEKLAKQYPQVAHQNKQKINQNKNKLYEDIK